MAALILAMAIAAAPADTVERWRPLIDQAAARFVLPADWIERVMRAESNGMTMLGGVPIRSRAGAMGLMQLMPGTWGDMRAVYGLGDNPDDPADNILADSAYLRLLYDRFGYPGLFAAYNAGPARYADVVAGRTQLPGETRAYIATVTAGGRASSDTRRAVPPPAMFVLRHDAGQRVDASAEHPADTLLFAIGGTAR